MSSRHRRSRSAGAWRWLGFVVLQVACIAGAAHAQGGGGQPSASPGGGGAAGGTDGRGGAANADFDSLIDLITNTVEQDSWLENGTGEGEIIPFPTGVYVDADGALRWGDASRALEQARSRGGRRSPAERDAPKAPATVARDAAGPADARRPSALRFVSLPRLEAAIAARQASHQRLDAEMLSLAGLERIEFILVYPATGDVVLAGPAGPWAASPQGGVVSAETGRPLVRLDDLAALWRRQRARRGEAFGCSITPRQEALARTQEFLAASAAQPLEPGQRRAWLGALRGTLGVQDVEYFGLDADCRVASILLAADYHMKLVGMGLAPGVPGVHSYLATVRLGPHGEAPPMRVLRWWFSMPAATVEASARRDAFALPGQCVEVLSENELLAARGERVHTGEADALTKRFADSFTREYAALADKYPVYGQLERIFELALALAVIEREGLAAKAGWTPELLLDAERLRLPRTVAVRAVDTVVNHRVVGGRRIIAGISGGVRIDGSQQLAVDEARGEVAARLAEVREAPSVASAAGGAWWWD